MINQLAVGYENEALLNQATALAQQLQLPLDKHAPQQLLLTEERLLLKLPGFSPLYPDFSKKHWQRRHHAGKKQGLVRACKPAKGIRIIDAAAGWGRDAAILASFGAHVLMLERHPIMAALLADALQHRDEQLQLGLARVDALQYLQALTAKDYPDVIYIDPMHPQRHKTALVKKDMQALQHIVGIDEDPLPLLELAQERVLNRVVVKWPQRLPPLLLPSMSVTGKTVRFDIYLKNCL